MYIFLELCSQAKLYAVVALLILLYTVIKNAQFTRYDILFICLKAAAFVGWTFALNKLCLSGYTYIAWLAAIIPHVIYIFLLINMN
jgi:hypothetical protein